MSGTWEYLATSSSKSSRCSDHSRYAAGPRSRFQCWQAMLNYRQVKIQEKRHIGPGIDRNRSSATRQRPLIVLIADGHCPADLIRKAKCRLKWKFRLGTHGQRSKKYRPMEINSEHLNPICLSSLPQMYPDHGTPPPKESSLISESHCHIIIMNLTEKCRSTPLGV